MRMVITDVSLIRQREDIAAKSMKLMQASRHEVENSDSLAASLFEATHTDDAPTRRFIADSADVLAEKDLDAVIAWLLRETDSVVIKKILIMANNFLPWSVVKTIALLPCDDRVVTAILYHPDVDEEILLRFSTTKLPWDQKVIAENPRTPISVLDTLIEADTTFGIPSAVLANPKVTIEYVLKWAGNGNEVCRVALLDEKKWLPKLRNYMVEEYGPEVEHLPISWLSRVLGWEIDGPLF